MKKHAYLFAFCLIAVASWANENPMEYDPYVDFAAVTGVHSTSNTMFTLETYALNPFRIMPETVTVWTGGGGFGSCQHGSCSGTSTQFWEKFSGDVRASFIEWGTAGATTTATYFLHGVPVGTTVTVGKNPIWHVTIPHVFYDEIELSWANPTPYKFTFESYDAVPTPEPSTLALLGSGLLVGMNLLRRRLTI